MNINTFDFEAFTEKHELGKEPDDIKKIITALESPKNAYHYTTRLIRKPIEELEPIIKQNQILWNAYDTFRSRYFINKFLIKKHNVKKSD